MLFFKTTVGERGHGESSWLLPSGESFAALSGHPALRFDMNIAIKCHFVKQVYQVFKIMLVSIAACRLAQTTCCKLVGRKLILTVNLRQVI